MLASQFNHVYMGISLYSLANFLFPFVGTRMIYARRRFKTIRQGVVALQAGTFDFFQISIEPVLKL